MTVKEFTLVLKQYIGCFQVDTHTFLIQSNLFELTSTQYTTSTWSILPTTDSHGYGCGSVKLHCWLCQLLCQDSEAVHVLLALHLGPDHRVPHTCHCVTAGTFARLCVCVCECTRKIDQTASRLLTTSSPGYLFVAVAVPTAKQAVGICRSDGKRPRSLTLIP